MARGTPIAESKSPREILGSSGHPTLAKAAMAWALFEAGNQLADKGRKLWRDKMAYTLSLKESDALYNDAHEWALSLMPEAKQRALLARSTSGGSSDTEAVLEDSETGPAPTPRSRIRLSHDSSDDRHIKVDGHQVKVTVIKAEPTKDGYRQGDTIRFTCRSKAGQSAVLAKLESMLRQRSKRQPVLRMISKWDSWERRADLPARPWESVVVEPGQKERLERDLEAFLEAEQKYVVRGIPWHRGYMLHGPPGTGKTSLVKALANKFNLDLWYVSLSDISKDSGLMALLSEVSPRSMLLLEDIDTVAASRDRETGGESKAITTGGLLNALDGVATPHGLITFMTTNHFESLDDALIRAGRMDVIEEVQNPGAGEIARLFEVFHDRPLSLAVHTGMPGVGRVSQADVAEALKRHLDSPDDGEAELMKLLRS